MMPMTANKQLYLGLTCIGLEEKLCGGLTVPFRGDPLGKQDSYLLGEGPWKPNEVEKWKVARERWGAGAVAPASGTLSDFCFPPLVPSPLPSPASGGGVCFESKCIWPQLCLPRWAAVRPDCVTPDCVTPSSSALDRSVHPSTHAYPLPPTSHRDTLRGARPQRGSQHWNLSPVQTCVNLSKRDRPWESVSDALARGDGGIPHSSSEKPGIEDPPFRRLLLFFLFSL